MALAAALWYAVEPSGERSVAARVATAALLALLAAQTLGWCLAARAPGPYELPGAPSTAQALSRVALSAATGFAAFASVGAAAEGVVVGLLLALLGAHAAAWLRVLAAWRLLGWFAGSFLAVLVPGALAATAALVVLALRARAMAGRRWLACAAAVALWAAPARLAAWRLRARYALQAETLAAEAGLPRAEDAERVSLAWLYPWAGRSARFEERAAAAAGVEVSPESLEKLRAYLLARDFNSVFAKQAVAALRQGWLFWWEADRALDAAMLTRPRRIPPDYKIALGLLRAGPIDESRYRRLERLAEIAAPRKEGFEDVNTTQLIFEGFASAYARFGDEESARPWLFRIDNLWPIYEKKVEITPVETRHDGRIEGTLLVDGQPAGGVKVGLFYVAAASATAVTPPAGLLSESDFPDDNGRFTFDSLAPGSYYLGLMGLRSQLRGRVLNSPGLIRLTSEAPSAALDPIRVER